MIGIEVVDRDSLHRINKIGFIRAGRWKLDSDQLTFELNELGTAKNVLYAFVVSNQVMYVGKTILPLSKRMIGYKNPGLSQVTNVKNNRLIRDRLSNAESVEIFALPDNGLLHYGGFHVNLAAGLEDSLVKTLAPPWNGAQKESVRQLLDNLPYGEANLEHEAVT